MAQQAKAGTLMPKWRIELRAEKDDFLAKAKTDAAKSKKAGKVKRSSATKSVN